MNVIKTIFAVSLIGISIHAKPIKIQCSDKTIEYDDQALSVLKSDAIENEMNRNRYWNGGSYVSKDNISIKLLIDSKGFAFMIFMAVKTDEQIFAFIDSLDEQAFRLVGLYTQLIQERRIADLLKYKMIKNPELQKLAEMPDYTIKNFVFNKYQSWNNALNRYDNLARKYLKKDIDDTNGGYQNDYLNIFDKATTDSLYAFFVLVDFYQETLKKPLPLNTDHLKQIFNAQPYDIQQTLINKNLVTVS